MEDLRSPIANQGSGASLPDLDLAIEELVLDGLAGVDRAEIHLALQRELTRLFVEQGVPALLTRGAEIASLDGGEFHMAPGSNAETLGSQIARVVYGGLAQ